MRPSLRTGTESGSGVEQRKHIFFQLCKGGEGREGGGDCAGVGIGAWAGFDVCAGAKRMNRVR